VSHHLVFEDGAGTPQHSRDAVEAGGQSQWTSLTGANKRMLHLLKRAKVQLIKIDQQKQLKMFQVTFSDTPVSGEAVAR